VILQAMTVTNADAECFEVDANQPFSLADLIGGFTCSASPKKSLGKTKKSKPRKATTSCFKLSNKLALQPQPKKKKSVPRGPSDILTAHKEKLRYFEDLQTSLPAKRAELLSTTDRGRRRDLEREIKSIESREEEYAYLLDTQAIISDYVEATREGNVTALKPDRSGGITNYIAKLDNVEKDRLMNDYYRAVDPMYVNPKDLYVDNIKCEKCAGRNVTTDGYIVCSACGFVAGASSDFQVSYKDVQDVLLKMPFAYKRQNRFREILSTMQAKENTDIPEHVIDAVQEELQKERNVDLTALDTPKVKSILKKLGLVKYYEHSPSIIIALNGLPPISIPPHVEEQFNILFTAIQEPFEIVRKDIAPTRSNFLSYTFCLYKFSELLGLEDLMENFPLLKSRDKLSVQDKLWKGICDILGWEFRPSM